MWTPDSLAVATSVVVPYSNRLDRGDQARDAPTAAIWSNSDFPSAVPCIKTSSPTKRSFATKISNSARLDSSTPSPKCRNQASNSPLALPVFMWLPM